MKLRKLKSAIFKEGRLQLNGRVPPAVKHALHTCKKVRNRTGLTLIQKSTVICLTCCSISKKLYSELAITPVVGFPVVLADFGLVGTVRIGRTVLGVKAFELEQLDYLPLGAAFGFAGLVSNAKAWVLEHFGRDAFIGAEPEVFRVLADQLPQFEAVFNKLAYLALESGGIVSELPEVWRVNKGGNIVISDLLYMPFKKKHVPLDSLGHDYDYKPLYIRS